MSQRTLLPFKRQEVSEWDGSKVRPAGTGSAMTTFAAGPEPVFHYIVNTLVESFVKRARQIHG